jgi:hypothetical protein
VSEANASRMLSKVKAELVAAVAISGGLLLAAGYLFVWAQLANAELPSQPILSALPTTVFVSAAIASLAVPFLVLLTLDVAVLAFRTRDQAFPGLGWWIGFGIALAVVARAAALVDVRLLQGWNRDAWLLSVIVAIAVVGLSAVVGLGVRRFWTSPTGVQTLAAAMLVLTVVAASAFRIADARTVDKPLPHVGVYLDTDDCPPVFDVVQLSESGKKQCYVGGFYLGESSTWIFVARSAERDAPGRLLLVPRDSAQLAATATKPLSGLPPQQRK